jgi:hypothetical protein
MLTMTDLGFLILAFFVVQFATVTPRPTAWLDIRDSLSRELTPSLDPETTGPTAERTAPMRDAALGLDIGYLRARLEDVVLPVVEPLGGFLIERPDGVALRLPAMPRDEMDGWSGPVGRAALATVGDALRFVDNRIAVVAVVGADEAAADAVAERLVAALAASGTVAAGLDVDGAVAQARFATEREAAPADGGVGWIDIVLRERAGDG